jgi:hypothetical protein
MQSICRPSAVEQVQGRVYPRLSREARNQLRDDGGLIPRVKDCYTLHAEPLWNQFLPLQAAVLAVLSVW